MPTLRESMWSGYRAAASDLVPLQKRNLTLLRFDTDELIARRLPEAMPSEGTDNRKHLQQVIQNDPGRIAGRGFTAKFDVTLPPSEFIRTTQTHDLPLAIELKCEWVPKWKAVNTATRRWTYNHCPINELIVLLQSRRHERKTHQGAARRLH